MVVVDCQRSFLDVCFSALRERKVYASMFLESSKLVSLSQHRLSIRQVLCLMLSLLLLISYEGVAETQTDTFNLSIQEIVAIQISGTLGNLQLAAPLAGAPITEVIDNNTLLQYTSVSDPGEFRTIQATINATTPAGSQLGVTAGAPGGTGTCGVPQSITVLTTTNKNLITSIGSCYTGNSAGNGSRLTYTFSVVDYGALVSTDATSYTITYTITAVD